MKVIRSWTNSTAREETQRLFGLVRDIRVEAQDLRSSLHEFQRASQQPDIGVRTRELEAAFKEGSRAFEDAAATIEDHFGQLRELQSDNPELYDEYGDKVTHAENLWLRALSAWQEGRDVLQTQQSQGQDIVAIPDDITRAAQSLDSLLHDTAFITIPERVNHLLRTKRDGQVLFFHDEFKNELPTEQWRKEMLHYLHDHPLLIEGVINEENGIIFRGARRWYQRVIVLLALAALAIFGGFGFVWVLCNLGAWFDVDNWIRQPGQFKATLGTYAFILVGGVAHVAVDAFKAARAGERSDSLLLDDWLLWVHVNRGAAFWGIIALWIGLLGSIYLLREQQRIPWETAFLVGYSADSFADLFLERFNTATGSRIDALRKRLTG